MNDDYKYWIVHGGTDSYFAAYSANDAWQQVKIMNQILLECDLPPTSKVEVVNKYNIDENHHHIEELKKRDNIGDVDYFSP